MRRVFFLFFFFFFPLLLFISGKYVHSIIHYSSVLFGFSSNIHIHIFEIQFVIVCLRFWITLCAVEITCLYSCMYVCTKCRLFWWERAYVFVRTRVLFPKAVNLVFTHVSLWRNISLLLHYLFGLVHLCIV